MKTRRTRVAPAVEAPEPQQEQATRTVARRTRATTPQKALEPAQETSTAVRRTRAPRQVVEAPEEPAKAQEPEEKSQAPKVDYDRIIASYKERATTPKNAIRAHCMECMGGMSAEVVRCTSKGCALFPFRMGENPFHKLSKHNRD